MDKLIEKLGLYEILNFLFTGIITYITSLYLLFYFEVINKVQFNTCISYLKEWYFIVLIYFLGLLLHEGSEHLEKHLFFKNGLPSERYFENNSHEKYREIISNKINSNQKTKFDLKDKTQVKQAFGIIYSSVQETAANEMIQKMNRQFGCFRAFSFIFIIEIIASIVLTIRFYILNGVKWPKLLIFIPLGIITWLSICRMFRFGKRFADYCYRTYAKDNR